VTVTVAVAVAVVLLSFYVAWRALAGDEKQNFVRKIAVFFASTGGTNFCNANLTDADFTGATLKCTKFTGANLTRTRFYEAKKILLARVGKSILDPLPIRTLLVTGNGHNKSYLNANLRGANLIGADLSGANLKGANITDATFQGANLETANLTLTEAIGTDFTSAQMTGACVEAWNISNTKLDNVDCRFIYLLEYPKPGTDDRERRPSSGDFDPGEFTKLFQEVLTTVDLIFRNGVDWKAFTAAFQKVQVENEDTELTIQSIENKGDGVVVIRVSVPPDTNKAKIHSEFTQNYDRALKAIEEKYQSKIESKDEQITLYRQQLEDSRQREIRQNSNMEKIIDILANTAANVPVNEREVKAIADRQTAVNLVILTLGTGDFNQGFPSVNAQIWTEGERLPIQPNPGELLPAPEIVEFYHLWQSEYNRFIDPLKSSRMDKIQIYVTNVSKVDIDKLAEELEEKLNKWLNAEQFLAIDRILRERFNRSDEIQVIIQSENIDVRRLPWHLWDFLKPYRKAEIALSSPFYDRTLKTAVTRNRIRILSILGDDQGIDIDKDRQLLAKIDAETAFLVKPNRQELNEQLWSEQGWDILCFSGHSSSEMDGSNGWIYINDTDKLTIPDLKNALSTAIERGLQIAIFNSCDGLGLANQLASLHIPQIIVMREPVPDKVAQEFLKHFLTAFASGKSFYLSVREAREKLQSLEEDFPCASWLPVICQNPAEIPPTWDSLHHT
ncbi:pentapeptide repeat-containing protein, partial [Tychonema bourrellyi]|uniref:pentapeptide repeat-containing protein n=1 Tax=Tychonema bourrellyi TaxID=54313 RepID=UPI0015D4DBE5